MLPPVNTKNIIKSNTQIAKNIFACTLLIFFQLIGYLPVKAQQDTIEDCINVHQINLPFSQNQSVLGDNIVYYIPDEEFSFWYKLNILQDCEISFSILPSNPEDDYDYILYRFNKKNFCEELVNETVLPMNSTQYTQQNIKEFASGQTRLIASQQSFKAKAGDQIFISVMNLVGEDCGHRLMLNANGVTKTINSVKKPCFIFSQPTVMDENYTANNSLPSGKNDSSDLSSANLPDESLKDLPEGAIVELHDSIYITGLVRDNETGKPITAKLFFKDVVDGSEFSTVSEGSKGYKIQLERGRKYELVCKSFGYYDIEGMIEFFKKSKYDFYMLRVKSGESFTAENIHFHPNTYAFKDDAYEQLEALYEYMEANPDVKIEVEGHTAGDNAVTAANPADKYLGEGWYFTGTAKKLSELRAEAVKKYLVARGIKASRIKTVGYGASKKLIPNPKNKEERAKNMRVEIKVIDDGKQKNENYPYKPSIKP